MVIIATLTILTSAQGANKAVGGVEREIDRVNYYLGRGTLGECSLYTEQCALWTRIMSAQEVWHKTRSGPGFGVQVL